MLTDAVRCTACTQQACHSASVSGATVPSPDKHIDALTCPLACLRRRRPHSVVLLERVDRAHPEVLSLITQASLVPESRCQLPACKHDKISVWCVL